MKGRYHNALAGTFSESVETAVGGVPLTRSSGTDRRSIKNIALTREYHWNYVGSWVVANVFIVLVAYLFVLASVLASPPNFFPVPAPQLIMLAGAVTLSVITALVLLGSASAHRMAGVHLKLTQVLLQVAEGDFNAQLKFRRSDRLEDVETAFAEMMEAVREGRPRIVTEAADSESAPGKEKRRLKNMKLTRKHHIPYMGGWVVLTVLLLVLTYLCAVGCLYFADLLGPTVISPHVVLSFFATLGFCALASFAGAKTAHRIAGVHVKLENIFGRVRDGERELVLRFRASDNLPQVEEAFGAMLSAIKTREREASELS